MNPAKGDESATLGDIARAGDGEVLRVQVKGRLSILTQYAARAPVMKVFRGAGVNVEGVVVGFPTAAEDDAHQIVGAALVVPGLHFRSDFVVGLRDHVAQFELMRVIPKRSKGENICHRGQGLKAFYQGVAANLDWPEPI